MLLLWIWLGRVVFGVYGWFLLFIPLFIPLFIGPFLPDFGDTADSEQSVLTQVFGRSDAALVASYALSTGWAIVAVAGWVAVLVTSIMAIRAARRS